MGNEITVKHNIDTMDQNVLRAVYALNMCTVSVSQIIDYNDIYILEQEYDAILNNINLEKMPKANALKKILVELLNTITFFRIQEIRKESIEKNYQNKVKNAIWSAIPNLNVIVANNPAAIAVSIASQVGIGYMNYRKEKASALTEKEKEERELRITAIEQFNALRRELFTTAWELAEEYEFDDRLRLTEKQIKQYNQILMDQDELRKFVRLETIQDNFGAFPPFWYNLGHIASYISGNPDLPLEEWEREYYRAKAKAYFAKYEGLNKFNILREDQMTAAFALEYVDLLLLEENPDIEKITELIAIADKMCGTSWDVKQLCAITYLKVGDTTKAANLLKQLVNEEYNTITNAKILSRIYVSQFMDGSSQTAKFDYNTLVLRIGESNKEILFPMPIGIESDTDLQKKFIAEAKVILATDYNTAIMKLLKKYTVACNGVIPAPYGYEDFDDYYGYTERVIQRRLNDMEKILNDSRRKNAFLERLADVGFKYRFIDLLNEVMKAYDELYLWRSDENHDLYIKSIRNNIIQKREIIKGLQDRIENKTFALSDYMVLQRDLSLRSLLGKMIDYMKESTMETIHTMSTLEELETAEQNLFEFCQKFELDLSDAAEPDTMFVNDVLGYLDYNLLGAGSEEEKIRKDKIEKKRSIIKNMYSQLLNENVKDTFLLLPDDAGFNAYFQNKDLDSGSLKWKTLLIVDDRSKKNIDLLFTADECVVVTNNKIKDYCSYNKIEYRNGTKKELFKTIDFECLEMGNYEFTSKNVNLAQMYSMIEKFLTVDVR